MESTGGAYVMDLYYSCAMHGILRVARGLLLFRCDFVSNVIFLQLIFFARQGIIGYLHWYFNNAILSPCSFVVKVFPMWLVKVLEQIRAVLTVQSVALIHRF